MDFNITLPDIDSLSQFNLSNLIDNGILSLGFSSYINLFGDFFWGLFFGIIGVAIYAWKSNVYALIGYLIAVSVLTRVVIPVTIADLIAVITGLAVTGLFYFTLVKRKKEAK